MRRSWLTFALFACCASAAWALPPIPKHIQEALGEKEEFKAYVKEVAAAMDKCASCHIPKADKKAKGHALNDFGQAMHKHLDDKGFKAAEKEKNAEEARKLFLEAWDKAIGEKNAEGKSYGDIIKSGKLPGKNE